MPRHIRMSKGRNSNPKVISEMRIHKNHEVVHHDVYSYDTEDPFSCAAVEIIRKEKEKNSGPTN